MSELAPAPESGTRPAPLGMLEKLSGLFRTYAIPKDSRVLAPPFAQDDRAAFTYQLPPEWTSDEEAGSQLTLLEDGQPLGPAHAAHDDIRTLGRGRYSHWGPKLYFSASDNSDPNSNGRVYSILPPDDWSGELPSLDGTTRPAGRGAISGAPAPQRVGVEWSVTDVDPLMILPVDGHAFAIPVPGSWPSDKHSLSTLMLLEDGRPLPMAHEPHAQISLKGRGRYSHWSDELRFSTTDNSDPRTNRRRYSVARSNAFLFKHAPQAPTYERGHCYVLSGLPTEWEPGQDGATRLVLLEDGQPLGPHDASRDAIRATGLGACCHQERQLWFSTSDNTDPTANGRTYTVVWLPADEDDDV